MGTNTQSDADSPDTDARLDAPSSAANRPNDTTKTDAPILADSSSDHPEHPRFFDSKAETTDNNLDNFVTAISTIAQSQCELATDYADIETLVCQLPIEQWPFAAHDTLAPYSGPYPMAMLVRRS